MADIQKKKKAKKSFKKQKKELLRENKRK